MKTYILFIFAAHKNQDDFVRTISKEVVRKFDSDEIKYYYGPESIIITFKTHATFEYLRSYIELVLGTSKITFFMTPYAPDNISFFLENGIEKHLFGTDKTTDNDDKFWYEQHQVQKLFIDDKSEISYNFTYELPDFDDQYEDDDDDDDDDLISDLQNREYDPTLDDILDKISFIGVSGLTKKELSLLNNYSKQI